MAEEHLLFFNYLMGEGATTAAARIALRAIAADPLSFDVWRRAFSAWPKAHGLLAFGHRMLRSSNRLEPGSRLMFDARYGSQLAV